MDNFLKGLASIIGGLLGVIFLIAIVITLFITKTILAVIFIFAIIAILIFDHLKEGS